jgi:glycosyltransferase involved in cell wall biosynthesis
MTPDQFGTLAKRDTRLLVHSQSKLERISQIADVRYLPFGVQNRLAPNSSSAFTIGTFGFLRPHKGIYELISAFTLLRAAEPRSRLKAYCAEYPNEESKLEEMRCMALIDDLDLQNHVDLNTQFPKQTVVGPTFAGLAAGLSACRARTRAWSAVHTANTAARDRILLASASHPRRSPGARPSQSNWTSSRLDLADQR